MIAYLITAALAAFASLLSTQNYDTLRGTTLTRGKKEAVAIGAGATEDTDIYCAGDSKLTLMVQMTGAAIGDVTLLVYPFEADNQTVQFQGLTPIRAPANALNAGKVLAEAEYDVSGFEKVRIRIQNNNVGAQTIDRFSWRLS